MGVIDLVVSYLTYFFFQVISMSGGNKAVELQLQIRQNAEDMMSFMRELESWETDIKKKDEELRRGDLSGEQVCFCLFVCLFSPDNMLLFI